MILRHELGLSTKNFYNGTNEQQEQGNYNGRDQPLPETRPKRFLEDLIFDNNPIDCKCASTQNPIHCKGIIEAHRPRYNSTQSQGVDREEPQ